VFARMKERYPKVGKVKRPANRPFATYSSHDPEGHLFDLTQPGEQNIRGVWSEGQREQDRYIKHVTIRAIDPEALARFYIDVFEFKEEEKALEFNISTSRTARYPGAHALENRTLSRSGTPRTGYSTMSFGFKVEKWRLSKRFGSREQHRSGEFGAPRSQ
jgi:hypothetical protein